MGAKESFVDYPLKNGIWEYMKVYVLWHVHTLDDDHGEHEVDRSGWTDGFTTVRYGKLNFNMGYRNVNGKR